MVRNRRYVLDRIRSDREFAITGRGRIRTSPVSVIRNVSSASTYSNIRPSPSRQIGPVMAAEKVSPFESFNWKVEATSDLLETSRLQATQCSGYQALRCPSFPIQAKVFWQCCGRHVLIAHRRTERKKLSAYRPYAVSAALTKA